ncbi:hypothetical protein CAPTEDRAFT_132615, partial [Capitella teleta]
PAYSPDLSPMEHLWDQLKSAISQRLPLSRNRQEHSIAAQEKWGNIPQNSNPHQQQASEMRACVDARGAHIRY